MCRVLLLLMAAAALAQDTGFVEGRITDSVTHRAIAGARVTLTSVDTKTEYSGKTDRSGAFRIAGLPRGQYTPRFQAEGYQETPAGQAGRNPLTVVPGRDPVHIEVELKPARE